MNYSGLACFSLFVLSICASYINKPFIIPQLRIRLPPWVIILASSTAIALATGGISIIGAGFLALFGAVCHLNFKSYISTMVRSITFTVMVLMALLAGTGIVPVFHSKLILDQHFIIENNPWHFNFGKYAMGVILFSFITHKIANRYDFYRTLLHTLKFSLVTIPPVIVLATLLGVVQKITLTMPLIIFFVINTFTTCIIEESFFRGILQKKLCQMMNEYFGIILISAFFALVHYPAGLKFLSCAFFASVGYGYAFYKTDKIECAILIHAVLNLSTLILFDYPIRFES